MEKVEIKPLNISEIGDPATTLDADDTVLAICASSCTNSCGATCA